MIYQITIFSLMILGGLFTSVYAESDFPNAEITKELIRTHDFGSTYYYFVTNTGQSSLNQISFDLHDVESDSLILRTWDSSVDNNKLIITNDKRPLAPGKTMLVRIVSDTTPEFTIHGAWDNVSRNTFGISNSIPTELIMLEDGDSFNLIADSVIKTIDGNEIRMMAYNGQVPGPTIVVEQDSVVNIEFTNNLEMPTTVHWHGLRLDNLSDGVPGITQQPLKPGQSYEYELSFPDQGVFFYHPHVRTDLQMEMGLYGNIIVKSEKNTPVDHEILIFLDDIKIENGDISPFSKSLITSSLMGRFGNTMFVNGETSQTWSFEQGDIVRFYLTNAANTRTFDFSIQNHELKIHSGDAGKYQQEYFATSTILSPSERQIVDVQFNEEGIFDVIHTTPHKQYVLGTINIEKSTKIYDATFLNVNTNTSEFENYLSFFDVKPDYSFELDLELNIHSMQGHSSMESQEHVMEMVDSTKIEWEDEMPEMNESSNSENTRWIIRDSDSRLENMEMQISANVGEIKKFRFFNDPDSVHPMQHPIHIHGQRFLVVSEDGITNENLVWKDTVLVSTGSTVDVLVEFTNPGTWVMHCHILEHAESGMIASFDVNPI